MTLEFSEIGFAPDFVDYSDAWQRHKQLPADVVVRKHEDALVATREGALL
ncbi:hypothetical protein [Pseudarthrobacter sp. S9]